MWIALQHCKRIGVNAWPPRARRGAGVHGRDLGCIESLDTARRAGWVIRTGIGNDSLTQVIAGDNSRHLQAFRAALSLVGEEPEEPVFDNGAADGAAEYVPDQFGRTIRQA